MKFNIFHTVLLQLLLLHSVSYAQPLTHSVSEAAVAAAAATKAVVQEPESDTSQLGEVIIESQAANGGTTSAQFKISLLPMPEQIAESVNLEHEALQSKILSTYDNSQQKVSDLTYPVPILDTIEEHEKYGNHGDMFDGISRSLVNGYESFSNLLNHIIQRPKEVARSISKGITAQLDIIGGKLVGL